MRRKPGQQRTGGGRRQKAIVYGPVEDQDRWEPACAAYCERRGYEVVWLVVGGPEKWPAVRAALMAGVADVAVVPDMTHLPADRTPRVESIQDELPQTPARRRTGRVQRWMPR